MLARAGVLAVLGALLMCAALAAPASAANRPGVQHLKFRAGPYSVTPGQNRIDYAPTAQKPQVDGYIVGIRPNLRYADGRVPRSDDIMFHHAVWLNLSARDTTRPGLPQRFFAAGEEKTNLTIPNGYGYAYKASDKWLLNYMIHNLRANGSQVYITYDIDFIPAGSAAAAKTRPARPAWMDVQNGGVYPVFDVLQGSGTNGKFTYPTQAKNPYPGGKPKNTWTVDRDSVLIGTAGHLHAGGLHNDLWVTRKGARYRGPNCAKASSRAAAKRCERAAPSVRADTAHLFESKAHYFEPLGPVSWDVSMTATPDKWRVGLKQGDTLKTTVTYGSKLASWYESMGIMVTWLADSGPKVDPFKTKVDKPGALTHGHLNENRVHGGKATGAPDPRDIASGPFSSNMSVAAFGYQPQGFTAGQRGKTPVVKEGQSLTFVSLDAKKDIYHSITSCAAPCNKSTGIGYPVANGKVGFDSGQLGYRVPAVGTDEWATPKNLKPGTYTYFCRIHPFMRGAFRVKK